MTFGLVDALSKLLAEGVHPANLCRVLYGVLYPNARLGGAGARLAAGISSIAGGR